MAKHFAGAGAIGMRETVGMGGGEKWIFAAELGGQRRYCRDVQIAAGQRRFCGPALARLGAAQIRREAFERFLGEAAIGRDLAAVDRQQRRAAGRVEFENVVAGGGLGFAGAIIIERANAGIGPDHVLGPDRVRQIFAHGIAKVFYLFGRGFDLGRIAVVIAIGGADQREIVLVGNDEDNAAVAVLEHVGAVVRVEFS